MKEYIYKFTDDNDTFIYVLAQSMEMAKKKILDELKLENPKFKYREHEGKALFMRHSLEKGETSYLCNYNSKSIVIC